MHPVMKHPIGFLFLLPLLLLACTPDPLPEFRENMIGKWQVSSKRTVLEIGSLWHDVPAQVFGLEVFPDGTLRYEADSLNVRSWEHLSRDRLLIRIPENLLLQRMSAFTMEFVKEDNFPEKQTWKGYASFANDTTPNQFLGIELQWELERVP